MNEVIQWLGLVAGGLASLGVIGLTVRKTIRFIQKAGNAFDSITALSEEIKPGEFRELKDHVMHELSPNSGKSMKDHVNAQTKAVADIREMLESHITNPVAHGHHPDTNVSVNVTGPGGN
ncbi:putative iron-regulated protein [Streptomyces canus]|uniref:Iron-regulated protein n=1 Tax=Streptomyces canus TaxID=58343 RepID=A0AAW8FEX5_9ACTN|nr:hypothetical protein [Streptomyces canus]MDQ0907796.1 putative iron-regulated protein [Streptomyces canus]